MKGAGAKLVVGAWQDAGTPGDVAANLETISRATAQAARRGVELLIFPECFLTGYYNEVGVEGIARQVNRDVVAALQAVARSNGTAILVGCYEARRSGIFNAALLFGMDGSILATYRKRALYGDWEKSVFRPGTDSVLVELCGIGIAVLICFDIEFPELARECARGGADLIAVPTALMEPYDHIARCIVPARAIENQIYVAYANRIGREHGLRYAGRSSIHDPGGNLLAEGAAERPELLVATVAKASVSAARSEYSYLDEVGKLGLL